MADKKAAPSMFEGKKHFDHTLMMLLVLLLISYLVASWGENQFLSRFGGDKNLFDFNFDWLRTFWSYWQKVAVGLTGLGALLWGYSYFKLGAIKAAEELIFGAGAAIAALTKDDQKSESRVNERWEEVLRLMNSTSPSDWRQAIIEADIMLEELLRANQYHGDTVGDMLKSVEPSDMLTLDNAWEAHKVRNRIAHSGSAFELNERETKRVISLFESVFKEYEII